MIHTCDDPFFHFENVLNVNHSLSHIFGPLWPSPPLWSLLGHTPSHTLALIDLLHTLLLLLPSSSSPAAVSSVCRCNEEVKEWAARDMPLAVDCAVSLKESRDKKCEPALKEKREEFAAEMTAFASELELVKATKKSQDALRTTLKEKEQRAGGTPSTTEASLPHSPSDPKKKVKQKKALYSPTPGSISMSFLGKKKRPKVTQL